MTNYRYWTDDEIDFVSDNLGYITVDEIADKLNRTRTSIKGIRYRAKLKTFGNFYTCRMLGRELGVNHTTVSKWIKQGLLHGKPADWHMGYFKPCYILTETNIVKFLKKHGHIFHTSPQLKYKSIPNKYFRNIVNECHL